ncbi:unnamed protein product, partial [Porites evermanni]
DLSSSSEDESAETTLNDDLPGGSERDVIEYYFYRDCGLKRRETVDEELKERVGDLIVQEICTGPDSLSGYRTMCMSCA